MSRWHSYLNSAVAILLQYKGEEPFAFFLKKYFASNKKFGSTDRKLVSHLCYCYFRLGKALPAKPVEERVITALFICSDEPNKLLEELRPEWNQKASLPITVKLAFIDQPGLASSIFPWVNELSDGISKEDFPPSYLEQPDLFLRIRPGYAEPALLKLNAPGINYEFISPFKLRLPNSFNADQHFEMDKEIVVQDYSSQRAGEFLMPVRQGSPNRVWDCCAASGGKSIMVNDILGEIDLTVSDVRESILVNLKKRFAVAGIKKYKRFVADLTKPVSNLKHNYFNLILADVPCSGSGTWSRTPEQLYYFDEKKIDEYADLQKKIITNIIPHLATGGHLLYITCSVFRKENEEAVDFIKEKFQLQLVKMELLKGYNKKADTMFAALLKKPL